MAASRVAQADLPAAPVLGGFSDGRVRFAVRGIPESNHGVDGAQGRADVGHLLAMRLGGEIVGGRAELPGHASLELAIQLAGLGLVLNRKDVAAPVELPLVAGINDQRIVLEFAGVERELIAGRQLAVIRGGAASQFERTDAST